MSNAHKSDLLLVVVTLLAAISWMFSKEAVLLMPPLLFMALRFLLAGGILALAAHRYLQRLTRDHLKRSVQVGLVFGVAMSCWIMGLFHASHVGEGAFLTSLGVVIVPVIARIGFGEPQPASTWLAIPVAVAGLALLSLQHGFRMEAGKLYFVAAACIFALFFILNTRAANTRIETGAGGQTVHRERVPALVLTAITLITVGLFASVLSLLLEPAWSVTFSDFPAILAWWVLASALIGTAARFFVQTYAQSLSAHSHGVVIMVLEPVWVALFAAGWFGETMSASQLGGCALIFAALLINRWAALSRAVRGWLRSR
ncbi:MAG: DMT family transporter [Marinobacter sp.]|uniref:DMT family transporter n=1 Tax=Marinobacter sp. TaxID=50741 RepID=UPI00299D8982|nr:DMT family transporter [Marinobacter sp.]MDX1633086.1 DMT family transporter [Marinobacter sp.]